MSKEAVNQIYDEAYAVYVKETMFSSDPTWLEPVPCMNMKTGEIQMGARHYHKERFIRKCKTDSEFSEKWGLKIEERGLSRDERFRIAYKDLELKKELAAESLMLHYPNGHNKVMDDKNIPTRLITVTYNGKTIESYE
jgi:hypothetical protein